MQITQTLALIILYHAQPHLIIVTYFQCCVEFSAQVSSKHFNNQIYSLKIDFHIIHITRDKTVTFYMTLNKLSKLHQHAWTRYHDLELQRVNHKLAQSEINPSNNYIKNNVSRLFDGSSELPTKIRNNSNFKLFCKLYNSKDILLERAKDCCSEMNKSLDMYTSITLIFF